MDLSPVQRVALVAVLVCVAAALALGLYGRTRGRPPAPTTSVYTPPSGASAGLTLKVHVAGAVSRPDVYELPEGSRVQQAVAAAGGFLPDADASQINLAARLQDGQKIDVPRQKPEPVPSASAAGGAATATPGRGKAPTTPIDPNTATLDQLQQLPGVGPVMAQRILDYRQKSGGFKKLQDLDDVPGIGPKRLEQIRPYVTLR